MQHASPDYEPQHNPYKIHRGFKRVAMATVHSLEGLRFALREESAFRQELLLVVLMAPWAFVFDFNTIERILLLGALIQVLMMELLNSGIEATVDRISFQDHSLSKRAKDYGSAAVFLALLLCGAIWSALFIHHLF